MLPGVFLLTVSVDSCPVGWVSHETRCYKFALEKKTWNEARADCQTDGGELTSIASSEEQKFIAIQTRTLSSFRFWIGLSDRFQEGAFEWSDNSTVKYTRWAWGEPNNHAKVEDCVEFVWNKPAWQTNECNSNMGYICKKDKGK